MVALSSPTILLALNHRRRGRVFVRARLRIIPEKLTFASLTYVTFGENPRKDVTPFNNVWCYVKQRTCPRIETVPGGPLASQYDPRGSFNLARSELSAPILSTYVTRHGVYPATFELSFFYDVRRVLESCKYPDDTDAGSRVQTRWMERVPRNHRVYEKDKRKKLR